MTPHLQRNVSKCLTSCRTVQLVLWPKIMSNKKADRVHLIENLPEVHKSRLGSPDADHSEAENDKNVHQDSNPLTTVVISSSSGVRLTRPTNSNDKRTGRYLAVGVTLIMIFITFYHTVLRQVPILAGLIPPAVIMVLYLLWILYFAKKRKQQVQIELA